ncbi:recombinase family protein [Candidatus Chloroploca sp. Khr17]|uniref:recombinase family protein n=1 Tax=Candidatus Chloroploca sp. Khr17 TaxID=2496869 RepID=UPI00196A90B9|nr:recombinase family protein [Candidatus Chloroploca sp. Khr17]
MIEVAVYVWVSTTRQQQTQTIEQQLMRLQTYVAAQPDWHLEAAHIYRDDGQRGAKLNRPGLDRLRDHARAAQFSRVVMTAPDRLARNDVHQVLLIDELSQLGCTVEFVDRPMSDDPHDRRCSATRAATGTTTNRHGMRCALPMVAIAMACGSLLFEGYHRLSV